MDPSEQAAVVTSSLFVQRSMFDSHVLPHIPFTSTINVALVQGISADTGCGSGANYPLSTPMIKVQNKTLLGSSQKLLYLQNSHCLVSIHKDFECQHDINDMTLCLMTSGSMRHQSLICGHRQVAFPQVVTCHLASWPPLTGHLSTFRTLKITERYSTPILGGVELAYKKQNDLSKQV